MLPALFCLSTSKLREKRSINGNVGGWLPGFFQIGKLTKVIYKWRHWDLLDMEYVKDEIISRCNSTFFVKPRYNITHGSISCFEIANITENNPHAYFNNISKVSKCAMNSINDSVNDFKYSFSDNFMNDFIKKFGNYDKNKAETDSSYVARYWIGSILMLILLVCLVIAISALACVFTFTTCCFCFHGKNADFPGITGSVFFWIAFSLFLIGAFIRISSVTGVAEIVGPITDLENKINTSLTSLSKFLSGKATKLKVALTNIPKIRRLMDLLNEIVENLTTHINEIVTNVNNTLAYTEYRNGTTLFDRFDQIEKDIDKFNAKIDEIKQQKPQADIKKIDKPDFGNITDQINDVLEKFKGPLRPNSGLSSCFYFS